MELLFYKVFYFIEIGVKGRVVHRSEAGGHNILLQILQKQEHKTHQHFLEIGTQNIPTLSKNRSTKHTNIIQKQEHKIHQQYLEIGTQNTPTISRNRNTKHTNIIQKQEHKTHQHYLEIGTQNKPTSRNRNKNTKLTISCNAINHARNQLLLL